MVRRDPRSGARYLLGAAAAGVLLSQPGHLLAYLGRYGGDAIGEQTTGVHLYFMSGLAVSGALLGALLLLAVAALAAARLGPGRRLAPAVGFLPLAAVLALVQLNVYAVQELLELEAAGRPLTGPALLAIGGWGLAGQLPLALLAAAALAHLSRPLLAALEELVEPFGPGARSFALLRPLPAPAFARDRPGPSPLELAPAFRRRGPPATRRP